MNYTIGIDFGSLSARAVLMSADDGRVEGSTLFEYPHGILNQLPSGKHAPAGSALQDPSDYSDALGTLIHMLIEENRIEAKQIIGLGLDTTSCTMLPVDESGCPLCHHEKFRDNPHAYMKLWKHHPNQEYADKLQALSIHKEKSFIQQFGNAISSEHFYPKIAEIADQAPDIYYAAARFEQVGDWLVRKLCGTVTRSFCAAAYKTYYTPEKGDLPADLLSDLHPLLRNIHSKLEAPVIYPGDCAGKISKEGAELSGLLEGTPVSASGVDAHTMLPGCHITDDDTMLVILGTSACEIMVSSTYREIPGLCGVVPDGIYQGMNAYEAGQSCVGDMFSWFAQNCVNEHYYHEASKKGIGIQELLTEKAESLMPGETGLLALDWWNGVRSTLMNFDLSGIVIGLTLDTKPEEIYRALLESVAFGTRYIIESMRREGVKVQKIVASGGISAKNSLLLQLYADICNCDVYLSTSSQSAALGSAMLGLAAARTGFSGLKSLTEAFHTEADVPIYHPVSENIDVYEKLYHMYCELYQYFGMKSSLLKKLKQLRSTVIQSE